MTDLNKMLAEMMNAKRSADEKLMEEPFLRQNRRLALIIGKFSFADLDAEKFAISNDETYEMGIFNKADFEAYVSEFFGRHF